MKHRRLVLLAPLGAALLLAGAAQVGRAQPDLTRPIRPAPQRAYAAWVPPGTYSAIVLNSSGDERRWAVSLMTTTINVPIVVPPADNIVIEFKDGWTVRPEDEARIVSRLVPFADSALYNKVGERPDYVLSAWGIGPGGPVQFVYRELAP